MDLKEEEILGDGVGEHWYYRSKSLALLRLIEPFTPVREVLDVGAGSGFFAREVLHAGRCTSVTCVDPGYASDRDEPTTAGTIRFRRHVENSTADLALFMDVLEHVDDDSGLLEQYARILGPGKLVAVTVPAFNWLWSGHDAFLEHRRRYTIRSLESVMGRSGVAVERSHYYFGAVLPAITVVRLSERLAGSGPSRSSLRPHSRATNRLLTAVCRAETSIQRFNRFAGLSVFALGIT